MTVSRGFYWFFACSLIILLLLISWSLRTQYQSGLIKVQEHIDEAVQQVAETLQNENVTLNNLAKSYKDEDHAAKIAFAIGMTQNQGKLSLEFGGKEEVPDNDTVPKFTKDMLERQGVVYNPSEVKTIQHFDSLLRIELRMHKLLVPYSIQKIVTRDMTVAKYASKLFIINFYEPDVYRIAYEISPWLIVKRIIPFIIIGTLLLLLFASGFILYHKSYRLQIHMSQFKESLLNNFTHELKTPVASLQLVMGMLDQDVKTDQNKEHIAMAAAELNRINLLTEKILSFGKLTREQFALNREVLNLEALITEAISLMKTTALNNGAQIIFDDGVEAEVMGDRLLLINLLTSMIDNAIKYSSERPVIRIGVQRREETLMIMIRDNGKGISRAYFRKIFEPFFRVPEGDVHNVKGHGLGLSFAAQVAKLHKGKITVESRKGQGSIFTIYLPAL